MFSEKFIEKIYAGWLAKTIGVRLGAPIEGWSYEKIIRIYGELDGYLSDYKRFAADDDINGPLFFLRALGDSRTGNEITSADTAEALLNYAPFEHGFFWWGGYGISTEHTAYLNLRNGIAAPKSGSTRQNGLAAAEQIGGQIFIDTWGLVTPGKPDLAARYARLATSVTHDGNGIYGGMFIAACISYAFLEDDILKIINKGLSYIPEDCEYSSIVQKVINYHKAHPESWRACYNYIKENHGYDKYPGSCHIIPNAAIIILALLYGKGDFDETLNICNMCGWDTDCNVGNVASIMGVRGGLNAINCDKWRKPVNDLLICSSVMGSLNIMDIPYAACYIIKLACRLSGQEPPDMWKDILYNRIDCCHFEFEGSTHAIEVKAAYSDIKDGPKPVCKIENSDEAARSGKRSLKITVGPLAKTERIYVYKNTYFNPQDFDDNRCEPSFSPLVYPGDMVFGSIFIPPGSAVRSAKMYAKDSKADIFFEGKSVSAKEGKWYDLSCKIPYMEGTLIGEIGFALDTCSNNGKNYNLNCNIDDLYVRSFPNYKIDFSKEKAVVWSSEQIEISQFTKLKGTFELRQNYLCLSCTDIAEAYTGRHDWTDYSLTATIEPAAGKQHRLLVRVQGGIRSYSAGLMPGNKLVIEKNDNGFSLLAQTDYNWRHNEKYTLTIICSGPEISIADDEGRVLLKCTDKSNPWLRGAVGIGVREGSKCNFSDIIIKSAHSPK